MGGGERGGRPACLRKLALKGGVISWQSFASPTIFDSSVVDVCCQAFLGLGSTHLQHDAVRHGVHMPALPTLTSAKSFYLALGRQASVCQEADLADQAGRQACMQVAEGCAQAVPCVTSPIKPSCASARLCPLVCLSAAHAPPPPIIQLLPCPPPHTPPGPPVSNLRDGAGYIFSSFMEAAGFTVGRARAYTGAAANIASSVSETVCALAATLGFRVNGGALHMYTATRTHVVASMMCAHGSLS